MRILLGYSFIIFLFTHHLFDIQKIKQQKTCLPLSSIKINEKFGRSRGIKSLHYGIDLEANNKTNVYSMIEGTLTSGYNDRHGKYVIIEKAPYKILYAHLSKIENKKEVSCGEKIGESGSTGYSTGPHLHLEVLVNEVYIEPHLLF